MNKNTKTIINTVVFLGIGVALMYWIFSKVDFTQIVDEIKESSVEYVVLAIIAGILGNLFRALRWNLLLKPMGYSASWVNSFHAVMLGYLVNLGLPRVGEITRPAVLSKMEGIPFNKLVGTIVTERIIDLLITLLIAIAIVLVQLEKIRDFVSEIASKFDSSSYVLLGVVLLIALIGILAIKFRKHLYRLPIINRFKSFIEGMVEGLLSVFKMQQGGLFIAYSLLIWFMYFLMPFFILYAIPGTSHLGAGAALTVLLFGTAAMIIPIPGGIGTFELLVPAALAIYSIPEDIATAYALLTHSIQIVIVVGVGLVSVVYFIINNQKRKNELAANN